MKKGSENVVNMRQLNNVEKKIEDNNLTRINKNLPRFDKGL